MTLYLLPESMGRAAVEWVEDHAVPGLVRVRLADGSGDPFDMPREMLTEIPDEPGPDVFAVALVDQREHYHTSEWWRRDNGTDTAERWVDADGWGRDWQWVVRWCLDKREGQLPVPLVVAPK